ncbi:uncharacterized protein [Epargyreus clarus]|uniref:uncharacterized protein n=1 Tax=Epargyreus clarus TaxID=520877 RepID=UPI003C2BC495
MSSFHERQKSLFKHLKVAEEQCGFSKTNKAEDPPAQGYGEIDKQTYRKLKQRMKQFRGRESIFKRPEAKLQDCLRAKTKPGFIVNPQNWTYYSLADVTPEQMSDATNTATALALMQELEEREEAHKMVQEVDTDETGATFKKPMFQVSKTIKPKPVTDKQIVFKRDKLVMPEYVVGVSQKKEKKKLLVKKDNTETKKPELKLNHLYEEEDDPES